MTPEESLRVEERVRAELLRVAYLFADACVEKAMRKLRENPERSERPHMDLSDDVLEARLVDEFLEWCEKPTDVSELEDIGNFAAWLHWRETTFK